MYQQGNRVKVVTKNSEHWGKEGTIELVYEDGRTFLVHLDGNEARRLSGFFENELELVENKERLSIEVRGSEDKSCVHADWTPEEIATLVKFANLLNEDAKRNGLCPTIIIDDSEGRRLVKDDED